MATMICISLVESNSYAAENESKYNTAINSMVSYTKGLGYTK